jgi:hypothetical protein
VTAEIQVEPEQVSSAGEIYIIAEIGGQFFMRVSDGTYLAWDLQINTLRAAKSTAALAASELISILS